MTQKRSPAILASAAIALVFLVPGRSQALNPNHNCSDCHDLHFSPGSTLLDNAVVETLCLTCHGPTGISTLKADVHLGDAGTTRATCIDCHNSHDDMDAWTSGTNIKMIGRNVDGDGIAKIATPNSGTWEVVFQSRGSDISSPTLHSFADNNEDLLSSPLGRAYDGICEVCHTTAGHHRNTGDPDPHHQIGRTCTSCHPHEEGFAPSGGSCLECHNTVQDNGDNVPPGGRRAVVGEFSLAGHHADQVTDADCVVCHDQSRHQQGRVRLFDVDTGLAIELTGDPATNATEAAKLETFCLKCHDADGANGSVPFSDGVTPKEIHAPQWSTGAHKTFGLTCYGDGLTIGCHNTGHGSQKTRLLAPYNVGPGVNNVNEEEGFCFNCHDGSPAPDIQAEFMKAIKHAVDDSLQAPGREVECFDCHNPHETQGRAHDYNAAADSTRNRITPAIEGVDGVSVAFSGLGNFEAPALGAYTTVETPTFEYQICFKCHSGYSWLPGSPPNGLSPNGSAANPLQTDLAQEFSPNNRSGHPVVTGLDNYPNSLAVGSPARKGLQPGAMTAPWNTAVGQQTMMCADCHNTDAAAPAAQGPHGSAAQFVLRGPNAGNWPNITAQNFNTSWCANCHNNSSGNVHTRSNHQGQQCYRCHVVIPHGGKISRLIGDRDTMPARYAYNNTLTTMYVQSFRKRGGTYQKSDCRASCTGEHGSGGSENW